MKTFSSPYFGSKKKQIGVVKGNVKASDSNAAHLKSLGGGGGSGSGGGSGLDSPNSKGGRGKNKGLTVEMPDKENVQISFGSMPSYRYANCLCYLSGKIPSHLVLHCLHSKIM